MLLPLSPTGSKKMISWQEIQEQGKKAQRTWGMGFPVLSLVLFQPYREQHDKLLAIAKAAVWLGTQPELEICYCRSQEQIDAGHTGECRDLRDAIFALPGLLEDAAK